MKTTSAFSLFLAFTLLEYSRVTGRCGRDDNLANTNWAACLVAENNEQNGNCPHGFLKLDVPCHPPSFLRRYTPSGELIPWKNLVCCVLHPTYDLKIKETPCMAGSPSGDSVQKKSHKSHKHH